MAQEAFPLHFLVWNNQYLELDRELQKKEDVGRLDPRGRTPLELAVCLGHLESTRVLLRHSSDPTHCNAQGWTSEPSQIPGVITQTGSRRCDRGCLCSVLQEAVSTGDPELVQLVLQYRDFKRATERLAGIPELLSKLRQARDFYVEMKWEFTSWGECPGRAFSERSVSAPVGDGQFPDGFPDPSAALVCFQICPHTVT
ncbi:unnamed protein product, partial [Tetraodon nigroviridis]